MQENRFHLAGYLAARPTLRSLPSGMAVANAKLGQTYRLSHNDLPAQHTNWFSLVFYGDLATLAMELEKGTNLYVEGSFDQRPTTDQNGRKRYVYEVTVQKFFRIGRASDEENQASPANHPDPEEASHDDIHNSDELDEKFQWTL
jgi:single stranded DNA-binding protein